MAYFSFFHRAKEEMNRGNWRQAERWLKLSIRRERHPLAYEYLLFVWLAQGRWKLLERSLSHASLSWEGIGWYVWYWYLWYQERWLDLEPCVYRMIASEHLFVRLFGLFRLRHYHHKPIEAFLSRPGIFEGVCLYEEEEKRAGWYRDLLQGNASDVSWAGRERDYERVLDRLMGGEPGRVWQDIGHVPGGILRFWERDPRVLWELGRVGFEQGEYRRVEQWLKKFLAFGKVEGVVWYLLGHVCAVQGKWKQAGIWYEKAIEAGLDTPSVWKNLAILTMETGYLKEASEYLKESLRLKRDPEVIYALAVVFLKRRRYVQAFDLLRRCLAYEEVRELAEKQLVALKRFLRERA